MPDEKTFRRRRAVFLLLVVATFILLTGSFVGAFGGAERGFAGIASPVQEGASKVAKPFRDLVNWVGDTFRAKGDLAKITVERDRLRTANGQLVGKLRTAGQTNALNASGSAYTLDRYGPVNAHVIFTSSSAWYRTIAINVGTSSGVRVDDPVVGPDGLVGKVIRAQGGTSIVRLITDPGSGVTARVTNNRDPKGLRGPLAPAKVGTPGDLILQIAKTSVYNRGDQVYTAGTSDSESRLGSRFPPDIPIGVISSIDDEDTEAQVVHVRAHADLRRIDLLTVLTAPETNATTP